MDEVNVLVLFPLGGEHLRKISGVSPNVKVHDASGLFAPSENMTVFNIKDAASAKKLDALLAKTDIMFGYSPPLDMIKKAPNLKWVQNMTVGVDRLMNDGIVGSPIVVSSMKGIHGTPVSELALTLMLMLAKQAPFCFQAKQQKEWHRFTPVLLRFQTLGILGLGNIGKEIARLGKSFGMRVVATRRSARKETHARNVDVIYPREQLKRLLSESDFVVMCLPWTPETDKMLGEKEFRAMKKTAFLVNVGRGATVDENVLIRALEEGWIAGAGLDVFATEPLPVDSRIWQLPNVVFSPHIAGMMIYYDSLATDLFCENLARFISGKKMLNVVTRKKGY